MVLESKRPTQSQCFDLLIPLLLKELLAITLGGILSHHRAIIAKAETVKCLWPKLAYKINKSRASFPITWHSTIRAQCTVLSTMQVNARQPKTNSIPGELHTVSIKSNFKTALLHIKTGPENKVRKTPFKFRLLGKTTVLCLALSRSTMCAGVQREVRGGGEEYWSAAGRGECQ